MIGKRGQEAAPFELLVAVIIMGFVIFAGMKAMSDLHMQKCYGETDARLQDMKTKLEIVVGQRSSETINFRLSGCFNEEDETVVVREVNEPELCASYCGAAKRLCILLQYLNKGSSTFLIRRCLNISPDTVFPTGGKCDDPERRSKGWELVDFREPTGIRQGSYLLVNKTTATGTFPVVCAWRKSE